MKRKVFSFGILIILLLILIGVNINMGSVAIPFLDIKDIIFNKDSSSVYANIMWQIRMPRIVASLVLGAGLSLSGYMLQTFFHNPIAGPFVLGISSGAKLLVAALMVFSLNFGFYISSVDMIITAFLGSLIVTLIVLLVSSKVKNMAVLIVCGVMVGYICSAVTELMISLADDSNIVNLHNWSLGSFSATKWSDVMIFTPVILISFFISLVLTKKMEAFSFGDEYATSLGMNVKMFKIILILVSSILSSTVTAFAGPISFVGIAVPHIMRELFKTDRPIIIVPASFLGGGVFCLLSDLVARCLLAPRELSISTVTAIFGAPVVIMMLLNKKKR